MPLEATPAKGQRAAIAELDRPARPAWLLVQPISGMPKSSRSCAPLTWSPRHLCCCVVPVSQSSLIASPLLIGQDVLLPGQWPIPGRNTAPASLMRAARGSCPNDEAKCQCMPIYMRRSRKYGHGEHMTWKSLLMNQSAYG